MTSSRNLSVVVIFDQSYTRYAIKTSLPNGDSRYWYRGVDGEWKNSQFFSSLEERECLPQTLEGKAYSAIHDMTVMENFWKKVLAYYSNDLANIDGLYFAEEHARVKGVAYSLPSSTPYIDIGKKQFEKSTGKPLQQIDQGPTEISPQIMTASDFSSQVPSLSQAKDKIQQQKEVTAQAEPTHQPVKPPEIKEPIKKLSVTGIIDMISSQMTTKIGEFNSADRITHRSRNIIGVFFKKEDMGIEYLATLIQQTKESSKDDLLKLDEILFKLLDRLRTFINKHAELNLEDGCNNIPQFKKLCEQLVSPQNFKKHQTIHVITSVLEMIRPLLDQEGERLYSTVLHRIAPSRAMNDAINFIIRLGNSKNAIDKNSMEKVFGGITFQNPKSNSH